MHKVRAEPLDTGSGLQVLRLVRLARGHHTHRSPWAWEGGGVPMKNQEILTKRAETQIPPCPNHCPAGALVPSPNTGGPGAAAHALPKNCNCLRQPPGREHGTGRRTSSKRSREQHTGRVGLLCHASTGANSRNQVDAARSQSQSQWHRQHRGRFVDVSFSLAATQCISCTITQLGPVSSMADTLLGGGGICGQTWHSQGQGECGGDGRTNTPPLLSAYPALRDCG